MQYYLTFLKISLSKFKEFGERVKPAAETQPEFTFYLWQAIGPEGKVGASQFYISAIADDSDEEAAA